MSLWTKGLARKICTLFICQAFLFSGTAFAYPTDHLRQWNARVRSLGVVAGDLSQEAAEDGGERIDDVISRLHELEKREKELEKREGESGVSEQLEEVRGKILALIEERGELTGSAGDGGNRGVIPSVTSFVEDTLLQLRREKVRLPKVVSRLIREGNRQFGEDYILADDVGKAAGKFRLDKGRLVQAILDEKFHPYTPPKGDRVLGYQRDRRALDGGERKPTRLDLTLEELAGKRELLLRDPSLLAGVSEEYDVPMETLEREIARRRGEPPEEALDGGSKEKALQALIDGSEWIPAKGVTDAAIRRIYETSIHTVSKIQRVRLPQLIQALKAEGYQERIDTTKGRVFEKQIADDGGRRLAQEADIRPQAIAILDSYRIGSRAVLTSP